MSVRLLTLLVGLLIAGCVAPPDPCVTDEFVRDEHELTRDFATTLEAWRSEASETGCDYEGWLETHHIWYMVVGDFADGDRLFLWRSSGFESERRHYDAETGEFIAAMFGTDVIDRACRGVFYWPRRLPFTDGRLTEVICDGAAEGFERPIAEVLDLADIGTTAEFYGTVTEEHGAKAQRGIEAITAGWGSRSGRRSQKPAW